MKIKRGLTLSILGVFLFAVSIGYSLVFAGGITGKIEFKVTNNIFPNSINLDKARIYISASEDISDINISGDCGASGELVDSSEGMYTFDIRVNECDKTKIAVNFIKGNFNLKTDYYVISSNNLYSEYIDYREEELNRHLTEAKKSEDNLDKYKGNYNTMVHSHYLEYLLNNRKYMEVQYTKSIIQDIISKRKDKYLIPIKGVDMTTQASKLPNAARPYRATYTEGIHEGWDFDTTFGNTVGAIDYGIVVRVVNNYSYSDLGKIIDNSEISQKQKMWNLDTLRGNQVWIKTMKGDMAFYAHLDKVFDEIKEGDMVFKGQPLGTVGITGVPDKNYSDYHLHLELRKTPYENRKTPYTLEDYMSWDWYFKGESAKYIIDNQYDIFKKNES